MALPVRYGGLGIPKPDEESSREYAASVEITEPLKKSITSQEPVLKTEIETMKKAKKEISYQKEIRLKEAYNNLYNKTEARMKRALECASAKGASSWLTTLPLAYLGYEMR